MILVRQKTVAPQNRRVPIQQNRAAADRMHVQQKLRLLMWASSAAITIGICDTINTMPVIDYAGANVGLELLDSAGQPTSAPFPNGGSVRW